MSKYLHQKDGVFALSNGTNQAVLLAGVKAFGQSLAKQWDTLTEVAAGVLVHYVTQEQVAKHGKKGDTTLIVELADVLADNNNSMYKAFQKLARDVVGIQVYLEQVDDTTVQMSADTTKLSRAEVIEAFDKKMAELLKVGAKAHAPKKKARAASSSKANTSKDTSSSEATSISAGQALADTVGITATLNSVASEAEQARLAKFGKQLDEILQHVLHNPNEGTVKALLDSTLTKLNNGFSLGAIMAKAG